MHHNVMTLLHKLCQGNINNTYTECSSILSALIHCHIISSLVLKVPRGNGAMAGVRQYFLQFILFGVEIVWAQTARRERAANWRQNSDVNSL